MSKKEDRREDNKRLRAAERQVIEGGRHRTVHTYAWGHRPDQPHIPDDAASTGNRKSGGCKRNKGGAHQWVWKTYRSAKYGGRTYYYQGWICAKCGKHSWTTPREMRK